MQKRRTACAGDIWNALMTEDDRIRFTIRMGLSKCGKSLWLALAKKHTPDMEYEIAATHVLDQIRLSGYDVLRVKPLAEAHSTPSIPKNR